MTFLRAFPLLLILLLNPSGYPPLGVIDFYGLRSLSEPQVRQVLDFHEGDKLDFEHFEKLREEAIEKIERLPGIHSAYLSLVCCTEDQRSMLYVGIEEAATPCATFQPAPEGIARLTEDVVRAEKELEAAWRNAVLQGNSSEDDSQGHALSSDPKLRAIELHLIPLAEAHLANLKKVLHSSSDEDQRAAAAEVLGYVKDKNAVVPDLVAAMNDPSSSVRNNAMRTLLVFSKYSPKPPGRKIQVPAQLFIAMLNSCIWTDRNKSAAAIAELTKSRDPALLDEIREKAFPSLIEMARWKSLGHAMSSLTILGRIGGLPDEVIYKNAEAGAREAIFAAVTKATPSVNKVGPK
jgi:HEAT repeats